MEIAKKMSRNIEMKRSSLLSSYSFTSVVSFNKLREINHKDTLGDLFEALALRVYGKWESRSKAKPWDAYWPLESSLQIIATLADFDSEIGQRNIMQGLFSSRNALSNSALNRQRNPLQRLWFLFVGEFVYLHLVGGRRMYSTSSLKLDGVLKEKDHRLGFEFYSSQEKKNFTEFFYEKFKGVVPDGCEIHGDVFGLSTETTKPKTFVAGEEFYVHSSRCPHSISRNGFDFHFSLKEPRPSVNLLVDFLIPVNLINEDVVKANLMGGPPPQGQVPLYFLTHHQEEENWMKLDFESKAMNYIEDIFSRKI